MKIPKHIQIFDNIGTVDRYTFVNTKTGDMLAASETGLAVFQYAGNFADNYWVCAFGAGWRRGCDAKLLKARIKHAWYELMKEHILGEKIGSDTVCAGLLAKAIEYLSE